MHDETRKKQIIVFWSRDTGPTPRCVLRVPKRRIVPNYMDFIFPNEEVFMVAVFIIKHDETA